MNNVQRLMPQQEAMCRTCCQFKSHGCTCRFDMSLAVTGCLYMHAFDIGDAEVSQQQA